MEAVLGPIGEESSEIGSVDIGVDSVDLRADGDPHRDRIRGVRVDRPALYFDLPAVVDQLGRFEVSDGVISANRVVGASIARDALVVGRVTGNRVARVVGGRAGDALAQTPPASTRPDSPAARASCANLRIFMSVPISFVTDQ